jgi:Ca2+-transporting ATPase
MRKPLPLERLHGPRNLEGLTTAEARARRVRYGDNAIVERRRHGWRDVVLETARDPMIWFLAGTSALYALTGQRVEALTLVLAIVPLVGMDVFLVGRTQASTEGLNTRLASTARVVRDQAEIVIPALDVVPGDLTVVASGEPFPADGVVIAGSELQADESSLSGESYPVVKRPLIVPSNGRSIGSDTAERTVPIEHDHWAFAGTRLLTGRASVRVVFTGGETVYGEIARSATSGPRTRTPLQTAIQGLVSVLVGAAVVLCVIIAIARLQQGHGWVDALVSAVTLASAALPEEFPMVFTFFLGVGVYRLARRQALVRRAVSVENIGRVSCICSDKTGTITEGRLDLTHVVPGADETAETLLALAGQASRADSGDPLDGAILQEARRNPGGGAQAHVLALFPFTEGRKRETAIVRDGRGAMFAATKGAAETVLDMCTLTPAERERWTREVTVLAEGGHKVVACASRPLDAETWTGDELMSEYRLAGLLAFEDPVREGVAQAVTRCRERGIHTIMVTGDHPVTARAVAYEIGLGAGAPVVMTAEELEACAGDGGEALTRVDVIARATPAQKLGLVRGLQERGEIVAVTGDGVNDVPALQAADVGIAMGERGTQSARDVASIVLLDDNFRTIVDAVAEGRQLFQNLQLSFQYLLMIHIPLVVTAAFVPLLGYPLLYFPIHIVWLELIIHPTALLVFQGLPAVESPRLGPRDSTRLSRSPGRSARRPVRFFSPWDWSVIAIVGGLLTLLVTGGYLRGLGDTGTEHGRALALAVLTLASASLTAALTRLSTRTAWVIAVGTAALSVLLVQTPFLAFVLHLEPLHADDWAVAVTASVLVGAIPILADMVGKRRR